MNVARQYGANEDNFKYEVSFSDREIQMSSPRHLYIFSTQEAPERGRLEGKRDFTDKPTYRQPITSHILLSKLKKLKGNTFFNSLVTTYFKIFKVLFLTGGGTSLRRKILTAFNRDLKCNLLSELRIVSSLVLFQSFGCSMVSSPDCRNYVWVQRSTPTY